MTTPYELPQAGAAAFDWPIRKGYASRAAIPPAVRAAIDCGQDDPRTLVEWLVVDTPTLLSYVLPDVGLGAHADALVREAREWAPLSALKRHARVGASLWRVLHLRPDAGAIYGRIAHHRSSVVREWGAQIVAADRQLTLAQRLDCARHYAADPHMMVREIAWLSLRPDVLAQLDLALSLLVPWVHDPDPYIRRCAVEGTRPRGVWCVQSARLKQTPQSALHLLEPLRADTSRYVQLSVGNWLNDASQSQPAWVRALGQRWRDESPTPETERIVQRALRTIDRAKVIPDPVLERLGHATHLRGNGFNASS
jgi:3-methyladenine DNA glycosylase AlkC